MVDGYIAALTNVFQGNGSSDACGTAGDGGGFGEEEVVRHNGWWGRFGGVISFGLLRVFVILCVFPDLLSLRFLK